MTKKAVLILFIMMSSVLGSSAVLAQEGGTVKRSDFIFAISPSRSNGVYTVYINTKRVWNEDGCLADGYTKEEFETLEPLLEEVGLCETAESSYEPCGVRVRHMNRHALYRELLKAGLDFDAAFQKEADTY